MFVLYNTVITLKVNVDVLFQNVLIKHTQEGSEHKVIAVIADFGLAAPIPHEK